MVEIAERMPGYHRGRMTGGGFGGCMVNLVDTAKAPAKAPEFARQFQTGITGHRESVQPYMFDWRRMVRGPKAKAVLTSVRYLRPPY